MRFPVLAAALLVAACSPPPASTTAEPAAAAEIQPWTRGGMVSAANPHAVAAAAEMLAKGGHAVDAAIAAHAVLGLVEPQSSGLGGSVFMLVYERSRGELVTYDGRETAPASATPDMFMVDGKPLGFREAWQAGIAVGVPGAVAAYATAHEAHGKLEWQDILMPAIRLARDGFEVSPRMHNWLARMGQYVDLQHAPAASAYLYPDGEAAPVRYLRKNLEYADTLAAIAAGGAAAFYVGDIAGDIVARAGAAPMSGSMTVEDIAGYKAIARDPVCGAFRDDTICSMPPPSSGVANIMMAGLYDRLVADDASQADRLQAFVDAQRLAYADRDHYVADADFVDVPLDRLLGPAYLDRRAAERFAPDAVPTHGDPFAADEAAAFTWGPDTTVEVAGTSHLSIIDREGNSVALTASVGAPFGSFRLVRGFLLNNEMSDFARDPMSGGQTAANVIAPGKRPRSSMSPTIVFDENDEVLIVTGSPGGNSILAYTTKSILAVLDWQLTAQQAADFPNIVARGEKVRVEGADELGKSTAADLAGRGYVVEESQGENSGIHIIVVRSDSLEGAADKRREGTVEAIN